MARSFKDRFFTPKVARAIMSPLGIVLFGAGTAGAVLGGLVIGILDSAAAGHPLLSNYRDAIAFGILILILLFKSAGLLGRATIEKV